MKWTRPGRRRTLRESNLNREIRSHLELEREDRLQEGLSPSEAEAAARRALGSPALVKELTREQWGWTWLETLGKDLRYAARGLRKNPTFTSAAVLTLALGMGANTAVLAVVNAVLLRPLPLPHPEQLVRLWDSYGTPGNLQPVSYPNFRDWRAWNHTFQNIAAYTSTSFVLTGAGDPARIRGILGSAGLLQLLGAQPMLGRTFLPEEDRPAANGSAVIIVSHKLWKERLGGDPGILGRNLVLDSRPFTVIGVMPPGFQPGIAAAEPDFWVTAAPLAELSGRSKPVSEERTISFLSAIGRLKPGVTRQQAQADLDGVAAALMRAYPADDPKTGVILKGLQESNTSDARTTLLLLFGAAGVVLLIACADVGGLVLARATRRQREMTVRAAIGASRWRILRQLLSEGLLLTALGAVAGLWLARTSVPLLARVLRLPPLSGAAIDGRVLAFSCAAAILATLLFSLAPALHSARTDLVEGLKESAAGAGESRRHRIWNRTLVVSQVALAMVLLSSSALLTLSLIRLQRVELGFEPERVLSFPVNLPSERYPQSQRAIFVQQLLSGLQTLPGVLSAGASGDLPMSGNISRTVLDNVAGRAIPLRERTGIAFAPITAQYFRTIGVPVRRGREFVEQDQADSLPVVVINEAAARHYFGSADPVGRELEPVMWNGSGSVTRPRTVVGVVGDIKQGLRYHAPPTIYWPIAQIPSNGTMYVTLRTAGDPLSLAGAVRSVVHALDKEMPLDDVYPLSHYVTGSLAGARDTTTLVALFAALAVILTAVGLYGLISYSVAQRTREIGIRMALGARSAGLAGAIVGRGLALSIVGAAIGLPAAIALARLFRSLLFHVSPQEPLSLAASAVILLVVALAASYLPARRAAKVDPLETLRYQ